MSISNLFFPNKDILYCGSMNTSSSSTQGPISITETPLVTPMIDLTTTDPSSGFPAIRSTSAGSSSSLQLINTNGSSINNSIDWINNSNAIALQIGNNNNDGSAYVYSATNNDLKIGTNGTFRYRIGAATGAISGIAPSISLTGYGLFYFSGQTIGAVFSNLSNFTTVDGKVYTFYNVAQGLTTTNLAVSRTTISLVKRIAGVNTIVSSQVVNTAGFNDVGLDTATLGNINNAGLIASTVLGVAGFTINWTGYVTVSY